VFLSAALFAVLGAAVLLWRSRWRALAFVALAGLFAAGFAFWYARQSPMLHLAAGVRIEERPFTQFDLWTWLSPIRPTDGSFPAAGLTRPVFATARQAEQSQARLLCLPDGRPDRFLFHLEPGQSIAFLSRDLRLDVPAPPALSAARGSFADFAATLYLRPGDTIAGEYALQAPSPIEARPVVVVVVRPPQKGPAREHKDAN
jgi:hypothetical protein